MRRVAIVVCLGVLAVACSKRSGGSGNGLTGPSAIGPTQVQSLWITDTGSRVTVGQQVQLELLGKGADGVERAVTADATWSADNTDIATVAANGRVTGVRGGTVNITAVYGGMTATKLVEVLGTGDGGDGGSGDGSGGSGGGSGGGGGGGGSTPGTTVLSVNIGGTASASVGASAQLTISARLSDGSTRDVTSQASYSSSNTAVATVAAGSWTAVAAGSATITARYGGVSGTIAVTVLGGGAPPPASTPQSVSISGSLSATAGSSTSLTATAHYANGSTVDVSSQATWNSSNGSVATVSGGVVTGVAAGSATITATFQGVSFQVTVTISAPPVTVTGLQINGSLNLLVGQTTQLSATATFSNGTSANVTSSVNWSSGNGSLASVSASGVVSGLLAGGVSITGTYQGVSAQVQVTITLPVVLQSISISGATSVKLLQNIQLTVTAHYSNGTTADITSSVSWSTDNGLLSLLTPVNGILRALGVGNCLVSASYQGKSAQHGVTITLL